MQLNQHMLNRLLAMNDERLQQAIRQIAAESGLDLSQIGITPNDIQALRQALQGATDDDLRRYGQIYDAYQKSKHDK